MKLKNLILIFLLSFISWIALNGSFNSDILITGIIISLIISILLCSRCEVFQAVKISPKSLIYSIGFLWTFWWDLWNSNIDVALRVLKPSLPINPGIVEVKTKLKSDIGKMMLANSITLTPGTLTVDIREDSMYIHWIDVTSTNIDEATQAIVSKFEKYLEVIYG